MLEVGSKKNTKNLDYKIE